MTAGTPGYVKVPAHRPADGESVRVVLDGVMRGNDALYVDGLLIALPTSASIEPLPRSVTR